MEFLKGKKTYIAAGIMVLSGLFNVVVGDQTIGQFLASSDLHTVLEGLGFAALRGGVAKTGN